MAVREGRPLRIWGTGAAAARQVSVLFGLSALLDVYDAVALPADRAPYLVSASVSVVLSVGIWLLPWQRWPRRATLVLAAPALVLLGWQTAVFGGAESGTGPFYVLGFAWLGLHHTWRDALWLVAPTGASYAAGLLWARSRDVVEGTLVLCGAAVLVAYIVSDRVRELKRARDELRRADAWRSSLMSTLAHDIRSPLTSVQGALEVLEEDGDVPPDVRSRLLAGAVRGTQRIRRLTTGLLDVDRVEAGSLRLEREVLDLRAAAERAVTESAATTDVRVEVPAGVTVVADPERLDQILVNLVTNAVRHGSPPVVVTGRQVVVDGLLEGTEVEVRDSGLGVAEADVEHLFQRFSSADRGPDSVGLGLWIVRQLVEAHGGQVAYRRVVSGGTGSRFLVTLPAVPVQPRSALRSEEPVG